MTSAPVPQDAGADSGLPTYITARDAAAVLHMNPYEVSRLCRAGKIRAFRPGRSWLITPDALREYVEGVTEDVA